MKEIKILAVLSLAILSSCTNSEKNTDFDKGPMLENIATNLAIPAYANSLNAFQALDSTISLLKENPSEKNRSATQNSWTKAAISWTKTAPYNFGPIDELLIENNFHYFPVDTIKLRNALKVFNGSNNFINELGSNAQGLGALEFIFYSKNVELDSSNLAFAQMLSNNLIQLNQKLLNEWKSEYSEVFKSSTGSNVNSSITNLTNQWIELAENIKNDKIGMPAGKVVGTEKNTFAVYAPFSKNSIALIKANLMALQNSFNGGNQNGIDDYLNALDIKDEDNQLLSEKINIQINTLMELLDDENQNLTDLIKNDDEKIDQIYLEALNLTILLKADMMGQLGLITTFSDSDGD